jgi:hypothetical protein
MMTISSAYGSNLGSMIISGGHPFKVQFDPAPVDDEENENEEQHSASSSTTPIEIMLGLNSDDDLQISCSVSQGMRFAALLNHHA